MVKANNDKHLGTSTSGWGHAIILALESLGIDGRQVFRDCGLNPDDQGKTHVRNPVAKMQYVWQIAENSIEDSSILAARIVQHLNASSFYALGFGLYASQSVEDIFNRICTYQEVISTSANLSLLKTGNEFKFIMQDLRPAKSHLTSDVFALFILKTCRELCGAEFSPIALHTPWPEKAYTDAFMQMVNAPVLYHARHYALDFHVSDVKRPLPGANARLASYQDKLCRHFLRSLDESQHLSLRVKLKILQTLDSESFSISYVASSLNMSARTLQRKLSMEQTNFRALLQEARKELVQEYVKNPELSATQISYMLGFANLPSFSSNFKSWFGLPFSRYRSTLGELSE